MSDDATKEIGTRRHERQQRLAEALRRNLQRRRAQVRGRIGDKPGDEPSATARTNHDADGN